MADGMLDSPAPRSEPRSLIVPAALMGAFMDWGFMVALDGGGHAVDWLLVVLPALLFMFTGFANWAIGAWSARLALRRVH